MQNMFKSRDFSKYNKRIFLYNTAPELGSASPVEGIKRAVWADVRTAGISTKYAAEAVGKEIELQVLIRKKAYHDETNVEYGSKKYRIDKVQDTDVEDELKLVLMRG